MGMREIVLDTETTGLDPKGGDRLIEIGCIELVNRIPTGREYHCYINPERDVPAEAEAVHGLSTAFLKDKPLFPHVADAFLEFIAGDALVIHNAAFDVGFLNAELGRLSRPQIMMDRVTCTLQLAKRRHPAGPKSRRAVQTLRHRQFQAHQARRADGLLLLAEVYVELLGVRQAALGLAMEGSSAEGSENGGSARRPAARRPKPLSPRLNAQDEAAHVVFVETLGSRALWHRYLTGGAATGTGTD